MPQSIASPHPRKRLLFLPLFALCLFALGACATGNDSEEPRVEVRGQYDFAIGGVHRR